MFFYNRLALTGRLTSDPEPLRFLPSGDPQAQFTIAHNRPTGRNRPPITVYIDVVTKGKQAEACVKHLRKGSPILVDGELRQETWTSHGETRKKHVLLGRIVLFLTLAVDIPGAEDDGTGVEVPES